MAFKLIFRKNEHNIQLIINETATFIVTLITFGLLPAIT